MQMACRLEEKAGSARTVKFLIDNKFDVHQSGTGRPGAPDFVKLRYLDSVKIREKLLQNHRNL
jgi:hypothetical protein